MCRFKISSVIPRGLYRIRAIGITLALLTTLTCDTQVKGAPEVERLTEAGSSSTMQENTEAVIERNFILNDESILVGHSGDPWGLRINESENLKNSRIRLRSSIERKPNVSGSDRENLINRRSRRSVVHLYNMVVCATGCNPMSYKGYGCYCGFLGSGSAVDGIDQCCRMHDRCYDATECPTFLEYFVPYYWKCYRGYKPICAVEHGKWGGSGSCAQRLCECDKALSECLRRFPCPRSKAVCTTSPWRLIQNVFMIF